MAFSKFGGMIIPVAFTSIVPTGWLRCDGPPVSRATYANLFAFLCPVIGTFTVTIASPAVFTHTTHGLKAGDPIYFTTTGSLPTGLSSNTIYYVIAAGLTANAFEVSATQGGSAIVTTGSQSGTHTLVYCPFGLGDGSTTFDLPNLNNRGVVGVGSGSGLSTYNLGATAGEATHTLIEAELPVHQHAVLARSTGTGLDPRECLLGPSTGFGNMYRSTSDGSNLDTPAIGYVGGAVPHENYQPFASVIFLIAYADVDPDYVISEIRIWPSRVIPTNWDLCDGASYTTASRTALFTEIGYTYGGSGSNFNVPDLQGRLIVGVGTGSGLSTRNLGDSGGAETVALTVPTIPTHSHQAFGASGRGFSGNTGTAAGALPAKQTAGTWFADPTAGTSVIMAADACRTTGSGTAHNNIMPVMALNFIIAKSQ